MANTFVQIGFNGHIYERTTDANGSTKLQVNLAYTGGYTFAVCYLGDDNYMASFAVAKITVIKNNVTLTAPTKSYKASSSSKTLTTTLKTSDGRVCINKTVKFTVNGKTYTGKTNANGVATVKVSLSTKKTYTYTVKFAGNNQCNSKSKSGKVTIS